MNFDDAEAEWGQLKDHLVFSAINVIGYGDHRQSDWFLEGEQLLSPSLVAKQQTWDKDDSSSHQRFKQWLSVQFKTVMLIMNYSQNLQRWWLDGFAIFLVCLTLILLRER